MKPEEIRCLDDAAGSGHILVVMFDLLYEMYLERGYEPREIPSLILRHNLTGIDIDRRACQLAAFALEMKAREKDRRFFDRKVRPRIIEIVESNDLDPEGALNIKRKELEALVRKDPQQADFFDTDNQPRQAEIFEAEPERADWAEALGELIALFHDAKNYGSLLTVPDGLAAQLPRLRAAATAWANSGDLQGERIGRQVLPLIEQAEALAMKYHAVVANPPYMGGKGMNAKLKEFAKKHYKVSKADLFAMFIERNIQATEKNAFTALVTMQSWMFLSSYEDLRVNLLNRDTLITMAHLGARAFDSIGGEVVSTTTFAIRRTRQLEYKGAYLRLVDGDSEAEKERILREVLTSHSPLDTSHCLHRASTADFTKIPGSPIAYWVTDRFRDVFKRFPSSGSYEKGKFGMSTADTSIIHLWHEVPISRIQFGQSTSTAFHPGCPFAPYDKGGPFRRWSGNRQHVINWTDDGRQVRQNPRSAVRNSEYFCKPHISWTLVASGSFSCRFFEQGYLLDTASNAVYVTNQIDWRIQLGIFNSVFASRALDVLNPTINFSCGVIDRIPIVPFPESNDPVYTVEGCVQLARADWDNFETSWDFTDLPLLREGLKGETLEASLNHWDRHLRDNIARMQELETENNRLWIEAYGLQDELTPEVPEDEITLARPGERERDMKAFVSYAVGCMMGRYALDKTGLILADAGDGNAEWEAKVGKPVSEAIFPPDADGVIPVLDEAYFPDDLTERLIAFVRTTFGPDRLNENLDYLADALTKRKARETSRDALRRYLATKFYADHVQTYKKRPIYWLFTSGKERAFQALVYLHRYRPDTLARMRTEYLHVVQRHLEAEAGHLEQESGDAKKLTKVRAKLSELREFDQKLKHYADRALPLDLDYGVKVNYARFYEPGLEIVEPIKGITDKSAGGDDE